MLKWVLSKVCCSKPSLLQKKWFLALVWLLMVIVFTVALQLLQRELISELIFMLISMAMGVLIGVVSLLRHSEKQWPFIIPHLSRESIENRINEIDT